MPELVVPLLDQDEKVPLNLRMDANDMVIDDIPNEMAQQAFGLIREGIDQARRGANAKVTQERSNFIANRADGGNEVHRLCTRARVFYPRRDRASGIEVEVYRWIFCGTEMLE